MFGHQLNGNISAFKRWMEMNGTQFECRFLSIDRPYAERLKAGGHSALSAQSISDMLWVVNSDVFLTDHGPGIYKTLKALRPAIRFIDVWHGIGFKGFEDKELLPIFGRYDRIFCSSNWVKKNLYVRQGLSEDRVEGTGCAVTDELLMERPSKEESSRDFDLPRLDRPIVMYAPTWSHGKSDHHGELDADSVIHVLEELAASTDVTVVVRMHLNSNFDTDQAPSRLNYRPMQAYPDTHSLIRAADVLITDWSSIATDFLVLNRPMIFIDTPDPFADSHLLTPDDRVGHLVHSKDELAGAIIGALENPDNFASRYSRQRKDTLDRAFGTSLDGKTCERHGAAIKRLVSNTKQLKH